MDTKIIREALVIRMKRVKKKSKGTEMNTMNREIRRVLVIKKKKMKRKIKRVLK